MFLAVVDMQHSLHVLIMACDHLSVFVWFPLSQHSLAIAYVYIFTTFTWTNCTRVSDNCTGVSHKINTSACRNFTVSPKLSRVTSSSCWTWAGGPLALHSWSETTLKHKIAFLGISMHFFKKYIYITSMSGMLFLLFVRSLFQFGAKDGKWESYYGEKNYLDMSFVECSHQFSHRKTLVEVSFCEHGMSRGKVVIIMASPVVSYQLWAVSTISWGCWNILS